MESTPYLGGTRIQRITVYDLYLELDEDRDEELIAVRFSTSADLNPLHYCYSSH